MPDLSNQLFVIKICSGSFFQIKRVAAMARLGVDSVSLCVCMYISFFFLSISPCERVDSKKEIKKYRSKKWGLPQQELAGNVGTVESFQQPGPFFSCFKQSSGGSR